MEKYTIYCTEEQTKKAFGLGAPIELAVGMSDMVKEKYFADGKGNFIILPTAEQMRGWLKTQGVMIEVCYNCTGLNYNYSKLFRSRKSGWGSKINNPYNRGYMSEKEATIAAIDKALEYLINERK